MKLGIFTSARLLVELRGIRRALERGNDLRELALRGNRPASGSGFFSRPLSGKVEAPDPKSGFVPDSDAYYLELEKKEEEFFRRYGRLPEDHEDLDTIGSELDGEPEGRG